MSAQTKKHSSSEITTPTASRDNLLELKHLLSGKKVKAPKMLVDAYPDSREFVEPGAVVPGDST